MITASSLFAIAVFAPLFGALIAGLCGRLIGDRMAQLVSIGLMLLASFCAIGALSIGLLQGSPTLAVPISEWIQAGGFHASWTLRFDALSMEMVAMVTVVATLIHIYSVGYMSHEKTPVARFFAYLSLFSFAMLMLVSSDNLVQLFFGWEGVGLASYLLIGYWYQKPSANRAAMKAFIVNRVGDLFFAVGIALVFTMFGSVEFPVIFNTIAQHTD